MPVSTMRRLDYIVDPATDCWVWQKSTRNGYGRARRGDRIVTAHVWYWEQENGPVPEGMDLDHTCHNGSGCRGGFDCPHRRCVNPAHLEAVPRAVNVQRGASAILTGAQVAEIRAADLPLAVLAEKYAVSRENIVAIRSGKTWRGIGRLRGPRVPLGKPQLRGLVLTDEQVAEIKATPRGYGSGRRLAHRFGVSDALISKIRGS